jgi:hypothetical protein
MGESTVTTTTFNCDWGCGATRKITDRTSDLNYAGVPQGWQRINLAWTSVMTTGEHKGTPYVLCPHCYVLFQICGQGLNTDIGLRFRTLYKRFLEAEAILEGDPFDG